MEKDKLQWASPLVLNDRVSRKPPRANLVENLVLPMQGQVYAPPKNDHSGEE